MKHLWKILAFALLSGAFALAQSTSPQSTSSTQSNPTSPSATQSATAQSQSSTTPSTQSSTSPSTQSSTSPSTMTGATLSQAESNVQDALTKQLPSSNVTVSTTNDNQLQLTGNVNSQSEKQHAEDIARSAAPGQTVVNKITVNGSSSDQSNPK